MALSPGTRLGTYEVTAPAGAGGMGEVYRARDSKLGRPVAIKVLGAEYSSDRERLQRFEREARAASALNHPNIVTIYDIGRQDDVLYLAMEFVEGRTLREWLDGGFLPLKKALGIAAQVAGGLAKAHAAGIVHRDLKPENIMVTGDGLVKILDFGLAKLAPGWTDSAGDTAITVVPPHATHAGVVMGTAGYMSPEQARGATVDFRSDQFSLGTVLYEMVTGKRPFQRESSAQTMAAIIEDEPPPITELNPKTPAPVRWIVERCLAKETEERYASTRDLARDLQRVRDHLSEASTSISQLGLAPAPAAKARRPWAAMVLAAVAALAIGLGLGAVLFTKAPPEPPAVRTLTFSGADRNPAASPDGRSVAFTSYRDGKQHIWLKELASGGEVPITSGPADDNARFSPDGSMIVFQRTEGGHSWVYRAAVVGGEVKRLVEGSTPDWSPDGKLIAFARNNEVWLCDTSGSQVHELRNVDSPILAIRWSPNGQRLAVKLRVSGITSENVRFLLLDADGQHVVPVQPAYPGGELSAIDWLGNDEVLYARSESVGSVALTNTSPSRIIRQKVPSGRSQILLWLPGPSQSVEVLGPGRLVLDMGVSRENLRVEGFKTGAKGEGGSWLTRGSSSDREPVYSPDGKWVAFASNRSGNLDLWAVSTQGGTVRRLTDDPADDWDPTFTADGKLLWSSHRSGNFEIWMAEADGSGPHQVSHDGVDAENPTATADGWIVYNSGNPKHFGLWKVRPDGSQAQPLGPGGQSDAVRGNSLPGTNLTNWPDASPDGKHVLASGNQLIRVFRVSDGAVVARIQLQGGNGRARWLPDGSGIAFVDDAKDGTTGLYVQNFVPGQDTSGSRRMLVSNPERPPESFAISRDGSQVVIATPDVSWNLLSVDGVAGVK
jgi:serine/threonine protein kinase/Tol biopolymer transport system component